MRDESLRMTSAAGEALQSNDTLSRDKNSQHVRAEDLGQHPSLNQPASESAAEQGAQRIDSDGAQRPMAKRDSQFELDGKKKLEFASRSASVLGRVRNRVRGAQGRTAGARPVTVTPQQAQGEGHASFRFRLKIASPDSD